MTTTVFNRQSDNVERVLSLSPVNERIDGESNPAEFTALFVSLAESIKVLESVSQIHVLTADSNIHSNPYYLNKYGDDNSSCDELGFERSYMGSRADHNHIF